MDTTIINSIEKDESPINVLLKTKAENQLEFTPEEWSALQQDNAELYIWDNQTIEKQEVNDVLTNANQIQLAFKLDELPEDLKNQLLDFMKYGNTVVNS